MAGLVAERGYPAVTVTDVVARARVSKRTFYEHFAEREDCFVAAYAALAERPLAAIGAAALDPDLQARDVRDQVAGITGAYLATMAEDPGVTRALLTEVASVGDRGRAVRREVLGRFADRLVALAAEASARHAAVTPLTPPLALALVGGINELVLDLVDGTAPSRAGFTALADSVTELVVAVLRRPPDAD